MTTNDVHRVLGRLGEPEWWGRNYDLRELWTEVAPNLWVGGTADADTVRAVTRAPAPWTDEPDFETSVATERSGETWGFAVQKRDFDAVCTLYPQALPAGKGVAEYRYAFADAELEGPDRAEILEAARWVHRRWSAGQRVLVRCQAGLNRSSYIAALAMVKGGWVPEEAIGTIRRRRSDACLFNRHFEADLLTQRQGVIR